ncbi:MAG: HipA domain-containing protein [Betaproteobacteria bacterium]|nr:HipA domain-containing protein [Betaproteobacteria bacterium]
MMRVLNVFIGSEQIGSLFENNGIWSFKYDEGWSSHGYPLSPGLPLSNEALVDAATTRPVQWFFDNLLPEDAARAKLFTSMGRNQGDAWDLLEQFGAESAGALTLLPLGASLPEPGLRPLSDADLNARILAMPKEPLSRNAPKKMSLAGAQEKLPVVMGADGSLFDPIGATPSTHILKPNVLSDSYPASAVNEWFCSRVAHELNIRVPNVELRHIPSSVFIIERFDRVQRVGGTERLHALDAVQLLSVAAGAKYAKAGVEALRDVAEKCRVKATTRVNLFRWTLFNALIGNGDAHLKNLSFVATHEGYALAPHYDLVSTGAWARPEIVAQGQPTWPNVELSFPVGNARTFRELTPADLVRFGEELGVPKEISFREIARMTANILPAAEKVMKEYEARKDVPLNVKAGQDRMVRAIIYLPLKTMQQQLTVGPSVDRNAEGRDVPSTIVDPQVTGTLREIASDPKDPNSRILHMTRAGKDVQVPVPSMVVESLSPDIKPGATIRIRRGKSGVTIEAHGPKKGRKLER